MKTQYPALAAWHAELRKGIRAPETPDALWQAACAEASAQEFTSIPELHTKFLQDAQQIIRAAAEVQRRERSK